MILCDNIGGYRLTFNFNPFKVKSKEVDCAQNYQLFHKWSNFKSQSEIIWVSQSKFFILVNIVFRMYENLIAQ